jgi:hypothetical protein
VLLVRAVLSTTDSAAPLAGGVVCAVAAKAGGFLMQHLGPVRSSFGLENHGIVNSSRVFWNLGQSAWIELPIRVVSTSPWHVLFAHTMFLRPPLEERKSHRPELTVLHAPDFQASAE